MVEIYNEELKDLLGKGPPTGKKLQIRHNAGWATSLASLESDEGQQAGEGHRGAMPVTFVESFACERPEQVNELLAKAFKMRSVGEQSNTARD